MAESQDLRFHKLVRKPRPYRIRPGDLVSPRRCLREVGAAGIDCTFRYRHAGLLGQVHADRARTAATVIDGTRVVPSAVRPISQRFVRELAHITSGKTVQGLRASIR